MVSDCCGGDARKTRTQQRKHYHYYNNTKLTPWTNIEACFSSTPLVGVPNHAIPKNASHAGLSLVRTQCNQIVPLIGLFTNLVDLKIEIRTATKKFSMCGKSCSDLCNAICHGLFHAFLFEISDLRNKVVGGGEETK